MPEATGTLSETRPSRLTDWIEHLKRTRLVAKRARAITKRRRAITEQRVTKAERLLAEIIAGADIIGMGADPEGYPAAYLLLAVHTATFNDLAIFGSELEDTEDTHDAEPPIDEATLGRTERIAQPEDCSRDDAEPYLGATQMVDQRRWAKGPVTDLEGDPCDQGEPDHEADPCDLGEPRNYLPGKDQAIIEEARSRFAAANGREVTAIPAIDPDGKRGAWLMLPRGTGGAK